MRDSNECADRQPQILNAVHVDQFTLVVQRSYSEKLDFNDQWSEADGTVLQHMSLCSYGRSSLEITPSPVFFVDWFSGGNIEREQKRVSHLFRLPHMPAYRIASVSLVASSLAAGD